jgi:serine O-acetyltransferase
MSFLSTAREDIRAIFERDPAARSTVEVLFCYPGLHAVWMHRFNHWLWKHHLYFLARFGSHVARFLTGIEIHPGATIGSRLFVDHGLGVVIGETAEIGDDVTIYQGVTLGGTMLNKGKRHPTLRNGVVIGGGSEVLGNIVIGENSRVGAGSVVLRDVPDGCTVVGVPAHIVFRDGKRVVITDPKEIQDPLSQVVINLAREIQELKHKIAALEHVPDNGFVELTEPRTAESEDAAMAALCARKQTKSEGESGNS